MARAYAAGKWAFGMCDRCGQRYPIGELREETVNFALTNLRVCPECWNPDHPQNHVGRHQIDDPQAIRNARPDISLVESRVGDSIVDDFDIDTTNSGTGDWTAGAVTTESWDSDGYFVLTSAGTTPRFTNTTFTFSPTTYKYVRVRFKVDTYATDRYAWNGDLLWKRDNGESYSAADRSVHVERPNFEQMGSSYHLITWDMSEHSLWDDGTNTIKEMKFHMMKDTGVVWRIDYISIDSS